MMQTIETPPTAADSATAHPRGSVCTTLLDVVTTVAELSRCDEEVVAVVDHMFRSGRMKLVGELTEQDFRI